jgi:hypothetical protein
MKFPPHDLQHPSRWYHQVHEIINYEFGAVSYNIASMPNFMKIIPAIVLKCVLTNITGDVITNNDVMRAVMRIE